MGKKFSIGKIAFGAILAAGYVALTLANPLSFPAIQFRVSEILLLVCFYNRAHCVPMIIGCFIANLFSPFGMADAVFGTLATALAAVPMHKMKNIWLASLLPVITNAAIIGLMLKIVYGLPFWFNAAAVGLGQLAVVTAAGAPLFRFALEKNKRVMEIIRN
ncbi:MAG: QueT transporter family protein [Oscillospiraceae bacterium]|jgi:uncharacterized membrane protein|nr:QueT transporter family protein [Oscillospiraceae bacterium]